MSDNILIDYDAKFDVLKIVIDNQKDSYGVDFPGGVVFRGIADDSVTGITLLNASAVIDRRKKDVAQLRDSGSSHCIGVKSDAVRKKAIVYTDGSCLENPGPGGWAAIIEFGEKVVELSGGEAHSTNNRMELMSVIQALSSLKEPTAVIVYADSQYVIHGIEKGWARNWQKNGWMKSNKQPALNPDLWGQLLELCAFHEVQFKWVKGHAGNPRNERCDELARGEASRFTGKKQLCTCQV